MKWVTRTIKSPNKFWGNPSSWLLPFDQKQTMARLSVKRQGLATGIGSPTYGAFGGDRELYAKVHAVLLEHIEPIPGIPIEDAPAWAVTVDPELPPSEMPHHIREWMLNAGLRANEFTVLMLRFWRELTLAEVGVLLGLSSERVRQIENRALRRMRNLANKDKTIRLLLREAA